MAKKSKYYQRPDGLYETIRKINGKRVAFRGRSCAEIDRKMIEYRDKEEKGRSFAVVADEWWEEHSETLSPNTLRGYTPAVRRAIEHFGEYSIKEIRGKDIQKFIKAFASQGYAQKTVTTQLLILNLIFTYAVINDDTEINPCTGVSVPAGLKKEKVISATPEEEKKIKDAVDEWLLPYLILYTGLRKGEALALTYNDIDLENDVIYVTKSVYHENQTPRIKKPKTEKGIRTVPILYPLKPYLPNKKSKDFVFSYDGGKTPLTAAQFQVAWSQYRRKVGITCSAHQLRHSFAVMLFECGVNPKDAQDILGHAQISTTMDIYTDIREARRKAVAAGINEKLKSLQF